MLQADQNGMYFTLTTSDEQDIRINMKMPVCILSLDSELYIYYMYMQQVQQFLIVRAFIFNMGHFPRQASVAIHPDWTALRILPLVSCLRF